MVCLFCILGKSSENIPRPISPTSHVSKLNQIIHLDYLSLGSSNDAKNSPKCVLVVEDDLSGHSWYEPTLLANSEHVAEILSH